MHFGRGEEATLDFEEIRDEQAADEDMLKPGEKRALLRWGVCILLAVTATLLLLVGATFFLRPTLTHGHSMDPTLTHGDRGLAWVWNYTPAYGDVVVIKDTHINDKYIVKRIIGLPGDVIDIDYDAGVVYRNGQPLEEPYTASPTNDRGDMPLPLTVPENQAFVLGDNRNNSTDSRTLYVGLIDQQRLMGRMVWRFYPFDKMGSIS